jgi:WD40 repeat protein
MSKFLGVKDNIWLFYSNSVIDVHDTKMKKLYSIESISRPTNLIITKFGFIISNQSFEFQSFELEFQSKSQTSAEFTYFVLKESAREILEKEQLNSLAYNEKQKKFLFKSFSGMIGQLKKKGDNELSLEVLWDMIHSQVILDVDVCHWKPWIISIGQDKTVNIWNHLIQRKEMSWSFSEELLSISIHPQGFFFCIGMSDKAVVYTLLANSPGEFQKKVLKEIYLKNVYKVQFSKGGNYLVICSENPNAVNVFQFQRMHCPPYLALKGHTNRIQDIKFSRFQGFLYTCSQDGMLYKWSLKDGSRQEMFSRGPPLYGICILNDELDKRRVMAVSDEKGGLMLMKNDKKTWKGGEWIMTSILFGRKSDRIFVGLKHGQRKRAGCIRIYSGPDELEKYQDYSIHDNQGVKKIQFLDNESKLVSLGFDNTMAIIKVRGYEEEDQLTNKILVTKRYIENLRSEVAYLTTSLDDDKGLNNNIITLSHLDDQIKELKEKIDEKEKQNSEEIKNKKEQKEEFMKKHRNNVELLKEKKENEISELTNFHAKKIANRNKELGKK